MIDAQTLLQVLQQLHQRNVQPDAGVNGPSPVAPSQLGFINQADTQGGKGKSGFSVLGLLGGLMDGKNAAGQIEPSLLTRINQGFTGQQQGQPNAGQALGNNLANFLGGFF